MKREGTFASDYVSNQSFSSLKFKSLDLQFRFEIKIKNYFRKTLSIKTINRLIRSA